MKTRDYTKLMAELTEEHHRRSPRSALVDEQAKKYLVDGAVMPVDSSSPSRPESSPPGVRG